MLAQLVHNVPFLIGAALVSVGFGGRIPLYVGVVLMIVSLLV